MQSCEILVDSTEYATLLKRNAILTALENAGVDNWEWYGDALEGVIE